MAPETFEVDIYATKEHKEEDCTLEWTKAELGDLVDSKQYTSRAAISDGESVQDSRSEVSALFATPADVYDVKVDL